MRGPAPRAGSLQPEELTHVAVVFRLTVLSAQVEAELVDHLDAVVAQPVIPAVGADRLVDAPANLVLHRRGRQLPRPRAERTARALAAEPAAPLALRFRPRLLRRRRRLAQADQHPRHLVARHVI